MCAHEKDSIYSDMFNAFHTGNEKPSRAILPLSLSHTLSFHSSSISISPGQTTRHGSTLQNRRHRQTNTDDDIGYRASLPKRPHHSTQYARIGAATPLSSSSNGSHIRTIRTTYPSCIRCDCTQTHTHERTHAMCG